MLNLTIAVTTYNEPQIIGSCLNSILSEKLPKKYEILVSCPDEPTINVIKKFIKKNCKIKLVKESSRKGKPTAINMILKKAKGKIIILMDGDTILRKGSIEVLLKHFENNSIGAVSGCRIEKSYNTMFNNWFEVTGDILHRERMKKSKNGSFFALTGSPEAIRNGLVKEIPANLFGDDLIIGILIKQMGYKVIFEPKAAVFGRLPNTIGDFIQQVARSQASLDQIKMRYKVNASSISSITFIKELFKTKELKKKTDCIIVGIIYILSTFYGKILLRKYVSSEKMFSKMWKPITSTKIPHQSNILNSS